ncbi:hypothetical protein M406DRAFT_341124 [Cryphonectria parasitica EP155]|uniref:Letm1 RBD domain-containing protein n=1 Tax=Cryphonectria parasitica (strain ATCC 38755 / EP155) TaxID=660469 RepID=A0A9P4XZA7_CRYP1|nr:uncharacterized protein M406DRAFT_341124 [Cryphonectria parasitica EP155]KAF3763666.1 hypothetical protein M406DRAFT_341124 [Cryphonectria parasitica EP155]
MPLPGNTSRHVCLDNSHAPRRRGKGVLTTTTTTTITATTSSSTAANPPSTTRPPPLELPTRGPDTSTFKHLFATGKAYLTFYKTGLRNIYLNTRLVWSLDTASGIPRSDTSSSATTPATIRAVGTTTRSTLLLHRRWRHDVRRLPLFALVLLVCGELTPFIVLGFPGVVPLTCRIPRQVELLRRRAETRRATSAARLHDEEEGEEEEDEEKVRSAALDPARAASHIARSLGLVSPLWDRLALPDAAVAFLARRRLHGHLAFLAEDDALLAQAGGAAVLEGEEVRLACEDRGLDVLGRDVEDAREDLRQWLAVTRAAGDSSEARPRNISTSMVKP